jgi:GNAT superfamily N-acetyltransferase
MTAEQFQYHPVTAQRWHDLERLFSASASEALGNPSRCWCMEWRLRDHAQWERQAREPGGEGNRSAMQAWLEAGDVPGILAYDDAKPVGWCSVSPRAGLPGLHEAGSFRNPQNPDVWSIVCFYVPETQRGRGIMKGLIRAALRHALDHSATIVEGYPMTPDANDDGAGGSVLVFEAAGFVEVARVGEYQRVMRYFVEGERRPSSSR